MKKPKFVGTSSGNYERHEPVEEFLFVRRPTKEDEDAIGLLGPGDRTPQPPLVVSVFEPSLLSDDPEAAIAIVANRFMGDGHKIKLLKDFVISFQLGIYPGEPALAWLAAGLEDWHHHQGKKSLEQCLGLKRPAGADPALKEVARTRMHEKLAGQYACLRYVFRLKHHEIEGVLAAAWEEVESWRNGRFYFHAPSERQVREIWKKAKWARDDLYRAHLLKRFAEPDAKHEYLDRFPRFTWEHIGKLKDYL